LSMRCRRFQQQPAAADLLTDERFSTAASATARSPVITSTRTRHFTPVGLFRPRRHRAARIDPRGRFCSGRAERTRDDGHTDLPQSLRSSPSNIRWPAAQLDRDRRPA
jgi:hypothetical protein